MVTALFQALAAGLKLWQSKESRKYLDRLIELKEDYYEEYNKDPARRSDAVLDNIERELRILTESFAAGVGAQDTPNQS
jgi:hypothetical protein